MSNYICPVCGSSKSVCSVEAVIAGGTHVTNTEGVSIGMFGTEGMYRHYMSSSSITPLAAVLCPPRKPWGALEFLFITFFAAYLFFIVKQVVEVGMFDVIGIFIFGLLGIATGIIPALISSVIGMVVGGLLFWPARAVWTSKARKLYSSSYCYRDNVVWGDDNTPYAPEDYVGVVFA